jgi:uroporphyrinogen decarboxylase
MAAPFSRLFDHIRGLGAFSSFFVCGNATANIEPMCKTGPDSISVDENVDLAAAKQITDRYNIVIGGNIPLTTVMLFGTQQDNMKATLDLIDSVDPKNLIVSPGCDMPYDTPIENSVAIGQTLRQPELSRQMIANYQKEDLVFEGELPDYDTLPRPLVEVFTLDSATCAACTYMLASAMDAKAHFGTAIDVVEYKYTTPQNIARMAKMGVKQLPSIYINGRLAYSSIIPGREELIANIGAHLS